MVNAFIQRFSNQWPLKALYNIAPHSPVHAHIHTATVVSTTQGDSQLVGSSQGEVPQRQRYIAVGTLSCMFIEPSAKHYLLLG